ncbi:hypothetical protein KR038_006449 [Drosophila bunnanda]|nr:hypothetical protein KR038_006449 [Drosophila bunnanda]
MADVCILCVDGLTAVPLKPNEIYRIGKQAGLEICIADDSMELAHGVVSLLRSGIVRLAAVAGRIFVNEEEKQLSDIGKKDASDGKVRLRFGNVEASLRFNEANEEAQDSSGFVECLKDRSVDATDDSLCIPETQPPSANASLDTTADSFFIPETQAIVFERPTGNRGKVSLGDDFMIPETENAPDPADLPQQTTTRGSDDSESSGMGSQIRICTQDFNEFNEDAIDDFDSSLMLGDALIALEPPKGKKESPEKPNKKQGKRSDCMSALNWSATTSKCNVFNSTKADEAHRAATCITPDLSAPLADVNRNISTPDILDLMEAHEEEHAAQRSNSTTPQLCGIKQLVVATIETPRTTQDEEDKDESALVKNLDINQDFVATQAFPSRFLQPKEPSDKPNQDFIATQVFASNGNISEVDQDFVATQAFPSRLPQTKESPEKPNQDFIATQVFPSKAKTCRSGNEPLNQDFEDTQAFPSRLPQSKESPEKVNQDFVATQAFPSRLPQPKESPGKPNQDFIATQVFSSKSHTPAQTGQDFVETQPFHFNKENVPQDKAPIKSIRKVIPISEKAELSTEDDAPDVTVTKRPTRRAKTKSRSPTPTVKINHVKKVTRTRNNQASCQEDKPKENPPKVVRTRRQTKCLDPEEVSTKPPDEIMTKQKAESIKEDAVTKRGAKKLVESAKKNTEEAREEDEQSASKRGRKKPIASAKKDSKEPKNLTKRRPGRPRKDSSSEDSISKTAMPEKNTRVDNSLSANEEKLVLEESLKLKKNLVVPLNKYLRQAKSNGKLKITFTVCDRQALNSVVKALKHVVDVTEDPLQCDVLIMDKGERTFKFLAAIALNKPVFNSKWLESMKSTKSITVKDDHLFNDSNFKTGFKFDPLSVLQHPRLLNGFNFLLCEGIQPNVNEMKVIIQSAGGTVHSKPPPLASSKDLYVVTTSKDKHSKQRLRNYENVHYIKTEGVMASLVQHKVELLGEHKVKL